MGVFNILNIGKKYVPTDNSYILNLTSPGNEILLAGSLEPFEEAKETIIVSMPYLQPIQLRDNVSRSFYFITVSYYGHHYRVLFNPDSIKK